MSRSEMQDSDRADVAAFIEEHWHDTKVMSQGRAFVPHEESGFIRRRDGQIIGLLTYRAENGSIEILTLNAIVKGEGIGTALILQAIDKARHLGCTRIYLTTTNDALRAIRFYQRLGFRMTKIHVGMVDEARKTKKSIPKTGEGGIGIHDEIVMELAIKPFIDEAH